MNKPRVVTRFLRKKAFPTGKYIEPGEFYRPRDLVDKEISVFNIDDELKNNDNEAIYKLADYARLVKISGRGDIKVEELEKILCGSKYLEIQDYKSGKHCAIRPFPSNDQEALLVAQKIVFIAKLHIRGK